MEIIGIDIGGTNTDGVLIDHNQKIKAKIKVPTTPDVSVGFKMCLQYLLKDHPEVRAIILGTTQATNAILEGKDLYKVGILRIAGQKPDSLPSGYGWPLALKTKVIAGCETINGGFECDGREITPFNRKEANEAIRRLKNQGAEGIAIVGVFSPLNREQEQMAAEEAGEMPYSISSDLGGIGFIERENSTILNVALKKVMAKGFSDLKSVSPSIPLFLTQNDGSVIPLEKAIEAPILTISAGPTNSFRGGARLAGYDNGIIIDIGGTSTDMGVILQGFPKRSLQSSDIGGVRLNFAMPDVLSIALGGGSIIKGEQIGPESVARELLSQAQAFGGSQLTLTDLAIATKTVTIPGADVGKITFSPKDAKAILRQAFLTLEKTLNAARTVDPNLPLILVGGGASLFPKEWLTHFVIPQDFGVANAYGAALSEISGSIDKVVSLEKRDHVLEELRRAAIEKAVINGADPNKVRLIDQSIIPYHYIPGQMARITLRASGPPSK
jgi:N-methylhydantoinase A/oxoprolinase/acetone carboxylase beta subunit